MTPPSRQHRMDMLKKLQLEIEQCLYRLLTGFLTVRNMLPRKDWTKILLVYMCLCHVIPAHPCGENPLRRYETLVRMLNEAFPDQDLNSILAMLRDSNSDFFRRLQTEWRLYANCVGLVDTGYFKRSGASPLSENRRVREEEVEEEEEEERGSQEKFQLLGKDQVSHGDVHRRFRRLLNILRGAWTLQELSMFQERAK